MKPRVRIGRLLALLILLFSLTFLWAGGDSLLRSSLAKVNPLPTGAVTDTMSGISGLWGRIHRIFFLKSAVDAKLDKKSYVRLADTPLALQQAIIAVEDNRFYQHMGFDIEGILRATLVNVQTGSYVEGGSTITQQLVKNLFLSQDRTLVRKIEEFILAVDIELRYSKEEILEMYLNTIYFGSGATGIGEASTIYFGKPPFHLNLAECAMLAGLPNAPSLTSPYVNFNAAKQRQAIVLAAMSRYNYIGPSQAQEAKLTPILLAK
ncbi:transglycosylase domain-containing protein [Sporomusa acidovorans]|uniref:Biosynthetic peptidoglycan transglycosylase n=1 Tax=Sporomusa acidovorans (strain ATCC 49682 / DSM 3132 / Mol) TaxID=1123286 RepID=A0ABZ3IWP0_SPOA4|nr:biosynthetic peptidoglycan transglycosylase [Sporomusa acidovorans]OZC13949.1 penicillin-binding protein 1F [Sporomusa acidovorans DSM 3132]SDF40021.1 penicillin-binding protein 1A [Sporomusa acidovorans]